MTSAARAGVEEVLHEVRSSLVRDPGEVNAARVSEAARTLGRFATGSTLLELTSTVRDHLYGLGPLEEYVAEDVTDILVNPDGKVWVEDSAGLRAVGKALSASDARDLAVRLAAAGGRRLDDAMPTVDARLPSGVRLHAVLPPLSTGGTALSLRFPSHKRLTLRHLVTLGTVPLPVLPILTGLIRSRRAFLISGGTGTGKTTLLSAMLARAESSERIIVVEDSQELSLHHPHWLSLQARHPNNEGAGAVSMADLIRQCLRMRPDRIVVGECRGAEVRELLQALNTGHDGGCGTIHANRPADIPARLEALGALGGLNTEAIAAQACSALDVIVHLHRVGQQRRVSEIALLHRDSSGRMTTSPAVLVTPHAVQAQAGWPELCELLGLPADTPGITQTQKGNPR